MKCKNCKSEMDFVTCNDCPNENWAYNLYNCQCGTIAKQNVWDNPGILWIDINNTAEFHSGNFDSDGNKKD